MPINSFLYPAKNVPTGYEVANSLRFNDGSSDYLNRTPSSTGNRRKFTFSAWIKRGQLGTSQYIFNSKNGSADQIFFNTSDKFQVGLESITADYVTSAVFRDVSAWYHFLVAVDTEQGTAANRVRVYVNGTEITSFSTETNPNQNTDTTMNTTEPMELGRRISNSGDFFDGYMAEVVFIDGSQLAPTSFGEFDSDSPTIWKPIDVSGLTFGTNGFYLDFENSSSLGNDAAGSNNFTVNNLTSVDQSTDTCTNNFCTMNPLDNYYAASTFSEGNCKIVTHAGNTTYNTSTFGLTAGKWYWEYKFTGTEQQYMTGIASKLSNATNDVLGYQHAEEYALNQSGSGIYSNSSTTAYGSGNLAVNDIISVALDLTNNNLYFAKNGQWGSGSAWDQTFSGALAYSITDPASTTLGAYFVAVGEWNSSNNSTINMNFGGSPSFSISSGNSDANGYGNFEYSVPSGYYAINSKNLAEFG